MLSRFALPGLSLPATVWRAVTASRHDDGATAADLVNHEQGRKGNPPRLAPELLALLALYPAAALLWVWLTKREARRHGEPRELALNDAPAVAIAEDGEGGLLLWFPEFPTTAGGDPMSDKDELGRTIDALQTEAEKIVTERGNSAAGHYQAHREGFEAKQDDLSSKIMEAPMEKVPGLIRERRAQGHDYAAFLGDRLADAETRPGGAGDQNKAEYYGGVADEHRTAATELRGEGPTLPQGTTLDESYIVLSGAAKEVSGYVPLDRQEPPTPDNDPDKPKGRGPAPDFGESAYLLLERGATGAQETGMTGHLFIDRTQAVDAARGYPMSQEDAARQGQTAWAEVHPVTPQFAANFADMEKAGRLDDMAALYSTAREIDGHLAPAHPAEPGAIKGELRENVAPEIDAEPTRPQHYRLAAGVEPAPDGTHTTRATFYDPNENREHPNFDAERGKVVADPAPTPPERTEAPNAWEQMRAAAREETAPEPSRAIEQIQAPAKDEGFTPDRQPGRYAELDASGGERGAFTQDLAAIAESRIVQGEAPSERVILTRQADESTARQQAELAESKGEAPREVASGANAWDQMRTAAKEETAREAASDPALSQGQEQGEQSAGRGGMSM